METAVVKFTASSTLVMIIVILRCGDQGLEEAEIRSNLGGELEIGMNGARNVPALARCKTQVSLHSSILERLPVEIRASEWPCQQPSLCLQPDLLLVTTYSRELSITCDCYQ